MRKSFCKAALLIAIGFVPATANAADGDRLNFIFYGDAKMSTEETRRSGVRKVNGCKNAPAKDKKRCSSRKIRANNKKALRKQK